MDCEYCNYCAKNWIFEEKKIWKISQPRIEPGTLKLWALSQDHYTKRTCLKKYGQRRMFYQVWAIIAVKPKQREFQTLKFSKVWGQLALYMTSRESKLFWYVFRVFQGICSEFFSYVWQVFFQETQNCLTYWALLSI